MSFGTAAVNAIAIANGASIVRVHEAGMGMRESTAHWFQENAERLSLESSLQTVLESYAPDTRR